MLEYPSALARGWDIGSGPTEAMCKNLTLRLKRPGMRWDTDHAAVMMNLIALRESGQWAGYWEKRRAAQGLNPLPDLSTIAVVPWISRGVALPSARLEHPTS